MSSSDSDNGGSPVSAQESGRQQYANKCELMLSLVGYAVGLGNIWRFPYLTYTYGGGAFLVPYLTALIVMGLPLFVLELGLGQIFRQGTLGIWDKLKLHRLQGAGVAATICTWLVSLYYNIILTWTIYYIGRTLASMPSGVLPWTDQVGNGFTCPENTYYIPEKYVHEDSSLFDAETGMFNKDLRSVFWCPNQHNADEPMPPGYNMTIHSPPIGARCPGGAAIKFWEHEVLRQSSGMNDLGSIDPWMFLAYAITCLGVYFIIFKGVAGSGKVVYVTAILPYVVLGIFFVRAITLENAMVGVKFFIEPDFSLLLNVEVWQKAVVQIFYSLGVGFGSLIAFASYGAKDDDFVGNAMKVSFINCGTSIFAGFVVFPILGYLAIEISDVNPCVRPDNVGDLKLIGLTGPSLAFVAFPIAISRMPAPYLWALLFFVLLVCLGIDSQFAMVESVMTVIRDSGVAGDMPGPLLAAIVCGVNFVLGLIFITRGGFYWFNLFDYYSCVVAMFFVTFLECFGLMWADKSTFPGFQRKVEKYTGITLNKYFELSWRFSCPIILVFITLATLAENVDLMGAYNSIPFPEGNGYLPEWSIGVGWAVGLLPIAGFVAATLFLGPSCKTRGKGSGSSGGSYSSSDDDSS